MHVAKEQQHITHLKLPFLFDEKKLLHDLELIIQHQWIPHFNTQGYQGNWNVIPLYNAGGNQSDIAAMPDEHTQSIPTPILKNCHYIKEVIATFKFPIQTARILKLGVNAVIKPHRDYKLGYEDGMFRLHIPIITNNDVRFILDDQRITMLPGECWYTNVNYVHSVSNLGTTERIHLVIDGNRNNWSDDVFFSLAPKERLIGTLSEDYTPDTIQQIIENLKYNDDPASKVLIKSLQKELVAKMKNREHK